MRRVNARIVDFHDHVLARQSEIICAGHRVRRHARRHARQVVGQFARVVLLDNLHAGQSRQRRPIRRRLHAHFHAERLAFLRQNGSAELFNLLDRRRRIVREQSKVQHRVRRQSYLVEGEQRRLHLVIRLVGNHRLRQRIRGHHVRAARRNADEIRVVRDVGNDLRTRRIEHRAERRANRPVRLHDIRARIALRLQVFWDGKIQLRARVNQRVLQQDRMAVIHQFADGLRRVA